MSVLQPRSRVVSGFVASACFIAVIAIVATFLGYMPGFVNPGRAHDNQPAGWTVVRTFDSDNNCLAVKALSPYDGLTWVGFGATVHHYPPPGKRFALLNTQFKGIPITGSVKYEISSNFLTVKDFDWSQDHPRDPRAPISHAGEGQQGWDSYIEQTIATQLDLAAQQVLSSSNQPSKPSQAQIDQIEIGLQRNLFDVTSGFLRYISVKINPV